MHDTITQMMHDLKTWKFSTKPFVKQFSFLNDMRCILMIPNVFQKQSFLKKMSLQSQNKFHHTLLSSHPQKVLNISRSQILDGHKN